MPPADDYVDACAYGRECAAHLAQYLKDNLERHNRACSARSPTTSTSAILTMPVAMGGFFNYAEQLMVLGALRCDVFQHVDSVHALQRALIAKTELEGKTPGRNS